MTTTAHGTSALLVLGLTWFCTGCGGFSNEEPGQPDGGAPVVVAISPEDGARGVSADTPIVVTFNEPVDGASAVAAVRVSGDVRKEDPHVSLDESGTRLTVTLPNGLGYAAGTDAATTPPRTYRVTIGTELTDLERTPLAEPFTASFSTLRRICATVPSTKSGEYYSYALAVGDDVNVCSDPSTTFPVGRSVGLAIWGDHFGIAAFEHALPEDAVAVESATFSALQGATQGPFYETGSVNVEELPFQDFDATIASAKAAVELGPLATSGDDEKLTCDVTAALAADVSHGERSFMYRLSPAGGPSNTFGSFYCDAFTLDVTYLVP